MSFFRSIAQRLTAHPLLLASVLLLAAGFYAWQSWAQLREAETTKNAVDSQLSKCGVLAQKLSSLTPPVMPVRGGRAVLERMENALKAAGAGSRPITSISINSSGALPGVNTTKEIARVDLPVLTLTQVGAVLNAIENSGFPCWVESADCSPALGAEGKWRLTLEIAWLVK